MSTQAQWREFQDLETVAAALESPPIYHVVRPIVIHGRSNNGSVCLCGCNSRRATVKRSVPHIDVLIDRRTGARMFKAADNAEQFDELARDAQTLYMPHRCSEAQYHIVRDLRRCLRRGQLRKVCGAFGGNRSGKTTSTEEIEVDLILVMGGKGRIFLNMAPTLEKATISIKKLIEGDAADRTIVPMIDPRLVLRKPKNGKVQKDGERVILIDGTEIHFRHGNADGDNIKGIVTQAIFIDELCAIKNIGNWHIALNRTMDTGGCVFFSTTPVQGHWAKDEVYTNGPPITEAGPDDPVVWTELSCFDNPWVDRKEIDRVIKSLNDDRLVDRDVYGKWVPEGLELWEFWDAKELVFKGGRDPEEHGFRNVTPLALRMATRGRIGEHEAFGGVDFNVKPMSLAVCQIVVPEGCDEDDDPDNWILWLPYEVVLDGGVIKFADYLEGRASRDLMLPTGAFDGMPMFCDATGAQRNRNINTIHGVTTLASSLVEFLGTRGYDARPCQLSRNNRPQNPPQIDSLNLLHKLMRERRVRVHEGCKRMIHAFEAQEQQSNGKIYKPPGAFEDKLSGPTDALRYAAWFVLSRHQPEFSYLAKRRHARKSTTA